MGIFSILFGKSRASIGSITIDASISEDHVSTAELTENPVEDGGDITDHVRIKPLELTIEGVISDTPVTFSVINNISGIINTVTSIFGNTSRSVDAYNELIKLQQSRDPFKVVTGLKVYENMILTELSIPRTAQTGNAIHFSATMRQIQIAKSETTGISTRSLSTSVTSLGQKNVNLGQKVTETASENSPLNSTPSSISQETSKTPAAQLFDTFLSFH